jgi:hypothetical protein
MSDGFTPLDWVEPSHQSIVKLHYAERTIGGITVRFIRNARK